MLSALQRFAERYYDASEKGRKALRETFPHKHFELSEPWDDSRVVGVITIPDHAVIVFGWELEGIAHEFRRGDEVTFGIGPSRLMSVEPFVICCDERRVGALDFAQANLNRAFWAQKGKSCFASCVL